MTLHFCTAENLATKAKNCFCLDKSENCLWNSSYCIKDSEINLCLKYSAKVLLSKGNSRYQVEILNTIPHKSLSTFMALLYLLLYNISMNFTCLYFAKKYKIISFPPLPLFSASSFFKIK